jgi:hypothetical protein
MQASNREQVLVRQVDAVYCLIYSVVGNREDAEDLTTETFLRIARESDDLSSYPPQQEPPQQLEAGLARGSASDVVPAAVSDLAARMKALAIRQPAGEESNRAGGRDDVRRDDCNGGKSVAQRRKIRCSRDVVFRMRTPLVPSVPPIPGVRQRPSVTAVHD